jgi:hypothetical protein
MSGAGQRDPRRLRNPHIAQHRLGALGRDGGLPTDARAVLLEHVHAEVGQAIALRGLNLQALVLTGSEHLRPQVREARQGFVGVVALPIRVERHQLAAKGKDRGGDTLMVCRLERTPNARVDQEPKRVAGDRKQRTQQQGV